MKKFLDAALHPCSCFVHVRPASRRPNQPPDPHQDRPLAAGAGPRSTGFLLGLVRKLIDYGKQLAATLQQHAPATSLPVSRHAGPIDIGLILARIARGLNLAAALEARLLRPARQERARPAPTCPSSPRQPRAAQPAARRAVDADPRLARLPTTAEIAAQVRRRPIGAVFADICRDLGIVPAHPLWRELTLAVIANGGRLTALFKGALDRHNVWITDLFASALPARPPASLPAAAGSSTGPP